MLSRQALDISALHGLQSLDDLCAPNLCQPQIVSEHQTQPSGKEHVDESWSVTHPHARTCSA